MDTIFTLKAMTILFNGGILYDGHGRDPLLYFQCFGVDIHRIEFVWSVGSIVTCTTLCSGGMYIRNHII